MLSAISVIRSDMFGARVPEAARGAEARKEKRGAQKPPPKRRGSPTHVHRHRGQQRRRARRARPGADPHRPRQRRGHQARRRLRLDEARPDRRLRRPVVRRGPRLHQRHLHRHRPDHPAHHDHARHPGPHRQDDPRAEEVDAVRLDFSAISDVGRVRKDNQDSGYVGPHLVAVCDGVGGAARGDIASSTAIAQLRKLEDDPPGAGHRPRATCSAWSATRCTAPTTGSPSSSTRTPPSTAPAPPPPSRSSTGSGSAWATSATAGPTSSATARSASSPTTTPSCRP